jgi:Ca-activated chloride channel family protein
VSAPKWAGSSAPEGVSAARARRLLAGGADRGDLPVVAAVALEPAPADEAEGAARRGKLQARVDLRPLKDSLAGAGATPVRVTVAASFAAGEPFVRHDAIDGQSLAGLDAWTYGLPVTLPGAVERVSVVFEELGTGAWGGAVAAMVEGELPAAVEAAGLSDADPQAGAIPQDLLPERKAVLLLPPGQPVVRGRVQLEPVVASARVARVEFLLDGEPAATATRPPFAARVDFGDLPAPHLVEAVGFDAAGLEVGRDALAVNEGVGAFRVRIIEPRSGDRVGAVDVEAEVKLPGGPLELDRVEVLWNGERAATLYEPPFRARVFVPPDAPVGYVQVVAHRTDGTAAEDLVFLNGTGPAERVDVKLVELFTVVEDPAQHPVRGLAEDDFQVYEDGAEQAIADFRAGVEVPLALGLVLDTSASMTPSLRAAQSAAIDFLLLALRGEEDRAFVVGFDARPQLVQPLTAARDELVDAIAGLHAGGTSALCDAVVFALVQMQRIPGRRALVVLTDGVGREERVDFGTCLRFVQRSGVPIYAILLAGDDPTAAERGGVDAEKLGRLVAAVGGRLFVAENPNRLGGVYRAVGEELRSQYLLTYYPERPAAGGEGWREVAVEVARPGLVARTLAGYYP